MTPVETAADLRVQYEALKARHRKELDEFYTQMYLDLLEAFDAEASLTPEKDVLAAFGVKSNLAIRKARKDARARKKAVRDLPADQQTWELDPLTRTDERLEYVSKETNVRAVFVRAKHPMTGEYGFWARVPGTADCPVNPNTTETN
nr:MAG TPA: hypothetical protein [Caudoviricetes sp.]